MVQERGTSTPAGQAFWRSGAQVWGGQNSPLLGDPSLQVFPQPPVSN